MAGVTVFTHVSHGAPAFVHHPTHPIPRAPPAHHFLRVPDVIRHPTPGGRGSPPLRGVGRCSELSDVGSNPSVTAQSAVTAPLSGEPREWVRCADVVHYPTPGGRGSPPLRCVGGRGAAHRRRPTVRRSLQKGPVRGPVLFALKCPRAFQAFFHGQIAQQRAGKPTPSRSLGKEQTMSAPVGGHWSRLRMTSIWKRSTESMYCSPG